MKSFYIVQLSLSTNLIVQTLICQRLQLNIILVRKFAWNMNTFIIKNKLKRIRKSGTYSRLLQKHKRRIVPKLPQKCPDQNHEAEQHSEHNSSVSSSSISEASFEVPESIENEEKTHDSEDSNNVIENIMDYENDQGTCT